MDYDIFPEYARSHVERWHKKHIDKGNIEPSPEEISRLNDWLSSLPEVNPKMMNKLQKLNWDMAMSHQEKWHEQLAQKQKKLGSFEGDPNAIEIIFSTPEYKFVEVLTDEGRDFEGNAMGHCVGKGAYDTKPNIKIFSLRDKNNFPHCTMEYDTQLNRIDQIKGRANTAVVEKYHADIFEFLLDRMQIPLKNIRDLEKIGYILVIQDKVEKLLKQSEFLENISNGIQYDSSFVEFDGIRIPSDRKYISTCSGWHTTKCIYEKNVTLESVHTSIISFNSNGDTINNLSLQNIGNINFNFSNFDQIDLYSRTLKNLTILDNEHDIDGKTYDGKLNLHGNCIERFRLDKCPNININEQLDNKVNIKYLMSIKSSTGINPDTLQKFSFDPESSVYLVDTFVNLHNLKKTFYSLDVSGISDTTFSSELKVLDRISFESTNFESIPDHIKCNQLVIKRNKSDLTIGKNTNVGLIEVRESALQSIGPDLSTISIYLLDTPIKYLSDFKATNSVILSGNKNLISIDNMETYKTTTIKITECDSLESLPDNITGGIIEFKNLFSLEKIPDNLEALNEIEVDFAIGIEETGLNLKAMDALFTNCLELKKISDGTKIENMLVIQNCPELCEIGSGVSVGGLNITGCHNIKSLPKDLDTEFVIMPNGEELSLEEAHAFFSSQKKPIHSKFEYK